MNLIITDATIKNAAFNKILQSVFDGDKAALIKHSQTITEEIKQELKKIASKHPFYKWCLDNFLLFHYNPIKACLESPPHTTPLNYHVIFREGDLSLSTSDDFEATIWLKTDRIYKTLFSEFFG